MRGKSADKISMAGLGAIPCTMQVLVGRSLRGRNTYMRKSCLIVLLFIAAAVARAQTWRPLGPTGGDVHSLAVDPSRPGRLFFGTADGHIFGSDDAGEHWTLLGRAG